MISIALGVPGVGKSTVLKEVRNSVEFEMVNYGDLMFELAKEKGLVRNRDQMRKLGKEVQSKLQTGAAEKIKKMAKRGNIVVDTHATIKTPYGYLPGLPSHVLGILQPDSIILVECSPETINKRRAKDVGIRDRDQDSYEQIREHQEINRYYASAYSALSSSTLLIINNDEGSVKKTAEKIIPLFKK